MSDGGFHVKVLQVVLLVGDNAVDVAFTLEAVGHGGKKTIAIWWEIDANNRRRLVGEDVEKPRILMGKSERRHSLAGVHG